MARRFSQFVSLFSEAGKVLFPILRLTWPVLLGIELLSLTESQLYALLSQTITARGREDFFLLLFMGLSSLAIEIVLDAAQVLILAAAVLTALGEKPFPNYSELFSQNFGHILIEKIRAVASIALRSIFFIIPGIIESFRLALVPYVVILDPGYHRGEVDALNESRKLVKPIWPLVVVAMLAVITLPAVITTIAGGDEPLIWENPVSILVGRGINFFVEVYFEIVLILTYRVASAMIATPSPALSSAPSSAQSGATNAADAT
jgi:hypothetical protein